MKHSTSTLIAAMGLASLCFSTSASAHCDSTKGPVVTAARSALEARDPNLVLHWVRPGDEDSVRTSFQEALAVRALGPEAKALADRHFFETLVRIHRAGEGAAFTGLTDHDPEPIIVATDEALASGSAQQLERALVDAVKKGLADRFAAARAAKEFRAGDVAEGRNFVEAYVPLTHWVEGVFTAASAPGNHHATEHAHAQPGTPPLDAHGGGHDPQRLPWILTALLALVACVQGFLLLRRHHGAPSWLKIAKGPS